MVPQRAYALVALVIGIGIEVGLGLPRPPVDVPGAEAAEQTTWRCVIPHVDDFYVGAHNLSAGKVVTNFSSFKRHGSKIADNVPIELAPRQTEGIGFYDTAKTIGLVEVRGPSPILVAGYSRGNHSPLACFKKAG